jgi:uncharacterized membrane protein YdfJ with MMPL/SSD domain
MQAIMLKLDALLTRRRAVVLVAWVAVLIAAVPFAARQSEHLTGGGFGVPGSESYAVMQTLDHEFPDAASRATLATVLIPAPGATAAQVGAELDRVAAAARATSGDVRLTPAARAAALRAFAAAPAKPLLAPLTVDADENGAADIATGMREELHVKDHAQAPVAVHLVGQSALYAGLQDLSKDDLATAEATGFPIVLLILLMVFGSLAAASLPLALGIGSVVVTGALIHLISTVSLMSVFATNMASMVGIGVAVDYSLFVLARYREEIHAGRGPDEARAVALATSGVAVLFSGATVIVSLAGLYMVNATAIRSMALGAILVVGVSMLAAATLLPVLIRLLGHRAASQGRVFAALQRRLPRRSPAAGHGFWERWTTAIMRRPKRALLGAAAILVLLAIPALSLQTGNGALRQFPPGYETRVGFEAAASLAGPGDFAPVEVVAPAGVAGAVARTLRADGAVARVRPPVRSTDGRSVLLVAIPRADGESAATEALIGRLRAELPPGVQVGGSSGRQIDFSGAVSGSMWKIVLFVLALSYVVLLILLRSVILPLKAVIANLLSVGTAYGVLVMVFQWGWVDSLIGTQLKTGSIDTITPPLVLAVVFGLSMDYEIFLLSRIRERFVATGDTRRAVSEGLATSARTITSAALIMVSVFAVFVGTGVPSIKQLGLGNAVAIAVDATLVRLILVPAVMELLGRWSWWMPRGLGRLLPKASLEELEPGRLKPQTG